MSKGALFFSLVQNVCNEINSWLSVKNILPFNTANYNGIPYLDVSTVYSSDKKVVYFNMVNRHKDKAIEAETSTSGKDLGQNVDVETIVVDDLKTTFSYENRNRYLPRKETVECHNNRLTVRFPSHSFVQLKLTIK